jgi:NodT family efflux transporter outer membrane factor (OMF) lipoprotein
MTKFWSMIAGTLLLLSIVALMSRCTVGPKFVRPEVPINQTWCIPDTTSLLVTRSKPDSAWWTIFGDSVLDSLVGLAFHQNLTLQIAGLRIMESRAQLAIAVGRQYPQMQTIMGSVTAVGVSNNISDALGINRIFLDYQVGFDAAWEADFWGKFRSNVRAQTAGLLATMADYDNALVSLTAEIARTYATIRTFEMLIDQAFRNAKIQEEGLRIAEARYHNGATSELDVTQATTLLESTKGSIPQLEISFRQAQNALSTLLGQPTGTVQTLLKRTEGKGIPVPLNMVSIVLPAELLRRRSDIRSSEFAAAAQCARIGISKSDLYPRFVLSGFIGTQSSSFAGVPSANLFFPGSYLYVVGPRIVWPIFNYGRITNDVRVQDARFQQMLAGYKNTVLKAIQEVEDGLIGYIKSKEAASSAQNAAKSAQRSVDIAFAQYREGAVAFQPVLEAERALLQQENTLIQTQSSIMTSLISLYKALGGGWELGRGQPIVPDSTRIEMQHRTNWGKLFSTSTDSKYSDSLHKER